MFLYKVPLLVICTGHLSGYNHDCRDVEIDGIGVRVYFKDEKELDPDVIRKKTINRAEIYRFTKASGPTEAVKMVFEQEAGTKIGGDSPESKVIQLDTRNSFAERRPFWQLPLCERLHKNSRDEFMCGKEGEHKNWGKHGMCVLENYDTYLTDCPLDGFLAEMSRRWNDPSVIVQIDGFNVVTEESLFQRAQ